jgi:hypothetical protein
MNSRRSCPCGLLPGCTVDAEVLTVLAKCPSDPSGMVVESTGTVNREGKIPGVRPPEAPGASEKREDFELRDV